MRFAKQAAAAFVAITLAGCGDDSAPAAPTAALPPAPDFDLSCVPVNAPRGCGNGVCTVTSRNGFSGGVALACSGGGGISCGLGPNPLAVAAERTVSAGLSVGVDWTAASRTHSLGVTATSGALRKTTTVSVNVGAVPRPSARGMAIVGCAGYAAGVVGPTQALRSVIVGAWRDRYRGRICSQTLSEGDGYFEFSPVCFGDSEPVYLTAGGLDGCATPAYAAGSTVHVTLIGQAQAGSCR